MDRNRKAAYDVLFAVETEGAYSNIALNDVIKREKPQEEAFVRALSCMAFLKIRYISITNWRLSSARA